MKKRQDELTLTLIMEEDLISTSVKDLIVRCRTAIEEAAGIATVVVDLSKVEMIDSQGLNFLIGLYQDAEKAKLSFRVVGASPANERLFSFVNLSERFGLA